MNFETWLESRESSNIPLQSVHAVLRLTTEGATVPFIARYRKEQTGNLDEVAIRTVIRSKEIWDRLIQRQQFVLGEIERQGKLTDELKKQILSTFEPERLEDLYLPYKQKRKTKAALAREAGLQELADWIWGCGHGTVTPQPGQTLEIWAFTFRNPDKGVADAEAAIQGAQDILVERLSEMAHLRQHVRDALFQKGHIRTVAGTKAKPNSKYENYFKYQEGVQSLLKPGASHRYLAIRRGWMEEELSLSVGGKLDAEGGDSGFEEGLIQPFLVEACTAPDSPGAHILERAARLAYRAHVFQSIESEVHKALKEAADAEAIHVFAENVAKVLLAAPLGPKAVLGVDPGIRTGCKLAIVDSAGKFLTHGVMFLQNDTQKAEAARVLPELVRSCSISAIAVGNGTAGRETEVFVRKVLKDTGITDVPVILVNESGASVYSASDVAREEFPDLDATVRGAISIARRLQDPLAELVKVDPKSIGVGQYQHDVSQTALKQSLEDVVDSCVNRVGVNLNTASEYLLARVSGIGPALARAVVSRRQEKGLFRSRAALLEVPRFSQKTFELAAGFLRVPESENPLDQTGVHPERYPLIEGRAQALGCSVRELMGAGAERLKKDADFKKEVGEYTFQDIVRELEKPGRDPRDSFEPVSFRDDIFELRDLKPGMVCPGIVTNVTNFGAFVDVGVHQDGLVHISQLANRFVKDPREVVEPGQRVTVRVLEINLEKKQIAFTMRAEQKAEERTERRPDRRGEPRKTAAPGPGPNQRRPSPNRVGGPGAANPQNQKRASRPKPVKQPFNNAFAGLAAMKVKR